MHRNTPTPGLPPDAEHRALTRRGMLLRLGLTTGAALLAPGMLAGPGRADTPRQGGTLRIGADADPIGLDPTKLAAFSSWDFTALLYSGLLRWNAEMQIEPDLATGFEQPDPTTYIFTLRQGVKFHNGHELTADDVKFTFDRILDPDFGSPRRVLFADLRAVTVIDAHSVRFDLHKPSAPFLAYLATNPNGAIIARGSENLDANPVGTGPFVFEAYQPNVEFSLTANRNYYEQGLPHLDRVVFRFYRDNATMLSALRTKGIDMTWVRDPRVAAPVARAMPDIVSAPGQTSRSFPVWMNLKTAPFSDVRVRRALSLATNRSDCVQTVLSGFGKVAAMIPESHVGGWDGTGEMPYYSHDPAAAKALLAEAGYPDGIDLGEYIVVAANPLDVACAQIMQQQWAAAGITVRINPMETAPLLAMWRDGSFPTLLSVALAWNPDADAILSYLNSGGDFGRNLGMADAELDAMLNAARGELDRAARADKHMAIQRHIADNAYCLQIYQYPLRWELWWNHVQGYVPLAANIRSFVRTTWLTA